MYCRPRSAGGMDEIPMVALVLSEEALQGSDSGHGTKPLRPDQTSEQNISSPPIVDSMYLTRTAQEQMLRLVARSMTAP